MKTFIHGTTMEALNSIKEIGFGNPDYKTVWNCSDYDMTYFREFDEDSCNLDTCIENAQIAAAMNGSQSKKLALIYLEVPDKVADEIFETDYSAENMEDCFQADNAKLNGLIKSGEIRIKAEVYNDAYMPLLRVFYLQSFSQNCYLDIFDKDLYQAIELLAGNDVFIEELYEYGSIAEEVTNFIGIEYKPLEELVEEIEM